jgi:hypothetical protein
MLDCMAIKLSPVSFGGDISLERREVAVKGGAHRVRRRAAAEQE